MRRKVNTVLCDNDTPILKAVPDDFIAKSNGINADLKRARFLAASIAPGDGFVTSLDEGELIPALFELLTIVARYDEADDREFLIFGIGEALYPTTSEGQAVISAYIARCASQRVKKGGRA